MTASRLVTIWCDAEHALDTKCEFWVAHEPTAAEARKVARSQGWVRRDGRDLSPTCAARETEQAGSDSGGQET